MNLADRRIVPIPIEPEYNTNYNQTFNNIINTNNYNDYFNDNVNNSLNNNNYNNNSYNNNYFNDFPNNNNNIFNNNINYNNNPNSNSNININNNPILIPSIYPNQNLNQNKKKKMVKNLTLPNFNYNTINSIHTPKIPIPTININNNIPTVQNQTKPKEPISYIQCKEIFGNLKPIENYLTEGNVMVHNKQIPVNELKNYIILRKKFGINIINYDTNLTSKENNRYCSYFKLQLEGAFYGINNFNLFIYICHKIQQNKRNFILITSGSSAKEVFDYCERNNINNIIFYLIFCGNKAKYENLIQKYTKLKGIFTSFPDLTKFIFSNNALMPKSIRIKASNFIFLSDYNSIFIKLHFEIARKYSLYKLFKSKNIDKNKFLELIKNKNDYYKSLARELLFNDDETMVKYFKIKTKESEEKLRQVFNGQHNVQNYISNYTVESFYYKYINKVLREGDFNTFRILSNHISKFIYHLYKYKKTNFQNNNSTLYRSMFISQEEYNTYRNSIGKIICYPSFTSTSLHKGWNPIPGGQNLILVTLEIQQNNCQSIINIMDLSKHKTEEEYLCLPFTFFKITNVVCKTENNIHTDTIYLTALNSEKPLEEMFLDFLENETDNLDPEGLEMVRLINDTTMVLNPFIRKKYYKKYQFIFK